MEPLARLAALFTYPDDRYAARVTACAGEIDHPALAAYARQVAGLTTIDLQERFIDTFDLNPAATLEIGWHLFGEQYERGEFLVQMRQRLRAAGMAESGELPDHLVHVLPLLGCMAPDDAAEFVRRCLTPALKKIQGAMAPDNLFVNLIRATRDLAASAADARVAAGGR